VELRVDGHVAVVTGAGRGIGQAVAQALADAGASVGVVDINPGAAEATAEMIRLRGLRAVAAPADVSDPGQVEVAVSSVRDAFGPVSILVTAAAIDEAVPIGEMSFEQWQRMLAVNLTGTFLSIQAAVSDMRAAGGGRIIAFGSNLAEKGGDRLAHYCAAKAGVQGLVRALARELAQDGIRINVVAPGPVETEMLRSLPQDWLDAKLAEMPLGRFGTTAEIVPTVVLLASDAGAFYTGSTINVSGGDVIP
jgi:3-oxoacyl-[acyl-carrier protein] reductase